MKNGIIKNYLFRAKELNGGKWVSGYYAPFASNRGLKHAIYTGVEKGCVIPIAVDIDTIEQYTGLHDKNDMRIFDGDIARVKYEGKTFVGVIQYDAYGVFIFVARNFGWIPLYKLLSDTDIEKAINQKPLNDYQIMAVEIIGNIIDNDIENFTGGSK